MAAGLYLFVDVDDATGRSSAERPASQRYNKEARKHVMREIGLLRREKKPIKVSTRRIACQAPNAVDGPIRQLPCGGKRRKAILGQASSAVEEDNDTKSELRSEGTEMAMSFPLLATHVGKHRGDPFVKYPVEMSDRALYLLDALLAPESGLRAFRIAWYNLALLDESTLNQVLSVAASALGKLQKDPASTELERQTADFDVWEMHMNALKRILDARGGEDSVKRSELRYIIFLIDTAGCCTRNTRPRFGLPTHLLPDVGQLPFTIPYSVDEELTCLVGKYPNTQPLSEILRDLSVIIQYFEQEVKKDPQFYRPSQVSGEWVLPLIHRCIDLTSDGLDMEEQMVFETLQQAIILFIQPIRRRFGVLTGPSDQRIRKLRETIRASQTFVCCTRNPKAAGIWNEFPDLFRWICVAASTESMAIEDQIRALKERPCHAVPPFWPHNINTSVRIHGMSYQMWYAGLLAGFKPFLNTSETEHLRALRSFIWMEDVFGESFDVLMDQVEAIKLSAPMWPRPRLGS